MPLTTLPLLCYGAAADLSTWSQGGTATVVSGITDPFGGTSAYSIEDNDAGAFEYRYTSWTQTVSGTAWVAAFVKDASGSGDVGLAVYDSTATTTRHWVTYSFAANAYAGHTVETGSGTVLAPLSVGGNWWCIVMGAASCVAGNTHQFRIYPTIASAGGANTIHAYVRNVVLLDYVDDAVSFPRPRPGSVWAQAPSGTEDAWITGTDDILRARLRWIPQAWTESPVLKAGWFGANETTGVNCGVRAMLTAGRAKQSLTWAPSRAAASTSVSGYLAAPTGEDAVDLEPNGDRALTVELRSSSTFTGL